ncbi:MAG: 50S ribosomal protein L33 [Nitrospinota bacterium]
MADLIALQCTVCKRKNYTTTKNKRKKPAKLELKKFCRFERKHTLHKEAKV